MHWMWSKFGLFTILFLLIATQCAYVFTWDLLGVGARILLFCIPALRFKPEVRNKLQFHLHWQSASLGQDWGFGFNWGGRRIFFFHSYMGWQNLSEKHHRNNCDDHAYCPWHGSL